MKEMKLNHLNHGGETKAESAELFSCPMHPEITASRPGRCPECGMALLPKKRQPAGTTGKIKREAHDKHAGHSLKMFLTKFWISAVLTVPVLLYSELPERFFGWTAPAFAGSPYLPLVFGSAVFFYGGWVFLIGAVRELRARLPGMMTLIGLAISTAYLYSVFITAVGAGHTLFWELTTLITVMLFGHWLEMKAVQGTQGALKELSKLIPDRAEVIRGEWTAVIPLSELTESDTVLVRPGERIPADGAVVEGASEVNESMVTGESRPVAKRVGSKAIAGTINGDGSLKIKVTKIGERTFLAGVMRLVREAQASKSRLQMLSDRAAFYLTLLAIAAGAVTFVAWILARAGVGFALERLVSVLVIACPHALGLAIPLVASISTALAARNGFLIRERLALELARSIDVVLFDKTGTLTTGEYGLTDILTNETLKPMGGGVITKDLLLSLAASVDSHSEHFIARAIIKEAGKRELTLDPVKDFRRLPGAGVRGIVGGAEVWVGGESILRETNAAIPLILKSRAAELGKDGKTVIFVVVEGEVAGMIALADLIREESMEAVKSLGAMGIRVAMITGDSEEVAEWVSRELGIDQYFARVLPQEKSEKVRLLQSQGKKVAMVGDGINDAPALMQADVGIAIGAGTNVAIESAGIILVRNDPRDIVKIIKLSRATYSKMLQNLFWATGYNIIALPLAAGILASKGLLLQPAVSAILMSLSTVIVAANAILLRRKIL